MYYKQFETSGLQGARIFCNWIVLDYETNAEGSCCVWDPRERHTENANSDERILDDMTWKLKSSLWKGVSSHWLCSLLHHPKESTELNGMIQDVITNVPGLIITYCNSRISSVYKPMHWNMTCKPTVYALFIWLIVLSKVTYNWDRIKVRSLVDWLIDWLTL